MTALFWHLSAVSAFSPQSTLYKVCTLFLSPQCSRSCNGGYRVREVRCLADNIAPSDRCDPSSTPESQEECNKQPCLAEISKSAGLSDVVKKDWVELNLLCFSNFSFFSFPPQIRHAATSIITAWWWFKPDSASTLTTEASAAPPAPAPTKHTPTHFRRTTSAGDAASRIASGPNSSVWIIITTIIMIRNSTVNIIYLQQINRISCFLLFCFHYVKV